MGKIRGLNSSPGVYTKFTDIAYAAKTLGVTTLGLVGETKIGPAFEPIKITNWSEYVSYFGGTSAEKFKDTDYPKYELPYIAKSYLTKSDQLYVCRVLGLSGYNAGPAFVITASKDGDEKHAIAVLRSRGHYEKYANVGTKCNPISAYDTIVFDCDYIKLEKYTDIYTELNCIDEEETFSASTKEGSFSVSPLNMGQFCIQAYKNGEKVGSKIPVSLNAGTKEYIYNVLGSTPDSNSSAPVFIEELYDLNLEELIDNGNVNKIDEEVVVISELETTSITDPVNGILTIPSSQLKYKNVGQTFLCVESSKDYVCYVQNPKNANGASYTSGYCQVGYVYIVKSAKKINSDSSFSYVYVQLNATSKVKDIYDGKPIISPTGESGTTSAITLEALELKKGSVSGTTVTNSKTAIVKSLNNGLYYVMFNSNGSNIYKSTDKEVASCSFSEYQEEFRSAMTPWIVSELKGTGTDVEVKKLFRFYTITDGNYANKQVKVSISNIKPDDGTFDVTIRDFDDSDGNITVLESYKNLTMVPGDSRYIGLKIGTLDGAYELKSKYVMVEVIENDITETCVPCGFLGYPVRYYGKDSNGNEIQAPTFTYNKTYDEEVKAKKQYFGLSDISGIDVDMLNYKGKNAYHDSDMSYGYTNAFHLDSTLSQEIQELITGETITVTVDGDKSTSSITWDTVSPQLLPSNGDGSRPIIAQEYNMEDTIYSDVNLRKFTVCFYGGFDGWDIYRGGRTNTDEFKANKYKGTVSNGKGRTFSKITNGESLALSGNCINSDYYAYLAGINQFENPEAILINIFATPGIDYVNNTLLVNDVFDMLEEKRGDSIYIPTTPDKPSGASDASDEMYTCADAVENLEDSAIDTYYGATYYPWVKYFDSANNKYIILPPTKDVVRNMADVDNKKYPWYAPAGIERGDVDCTKAHLFTKLDDENTLYDGRINPIKTFYKDGVKVWGNKTMYTGDTPMNRVNVVRLMLYMRKLIVEASRVLIFEPNDATLKSQFESIIKPILSNIKADRGITDCKLVTSQTTEQMDAHEMSANIYVKPTPAMEYIEINFTVTPQGVDFEDIQ